MWEASVNSAAIHIQQARGFRDIAASLFKRALNEGLLGLFEIEGQILHLGGRGFPRGRQWRTRGRKELEKCGFDRLSATEDERTLHDIF